MGEGPNRKRTVQTESMNRREAAEESAAYRTALDEVAGRNASGSVRGAASAASDEGHCIGQGAGLLEQMIERGNLNAAWKQVRRNKGAAGVDGLDFERTATLIRNEWDKIEALLLAGRYQPRPRLRCVIWRQWKRPATRCKRLRALGLDEARVRASGHNGRGAWFNSGASHLHAAFPAKAFAAMGLINLLDTLNAYANSSS